MTQSKHETFGLFTLGEKCPNTESFLVFSRIHAEYGDLLQKSLYSVQMQENMGQKKLRIWTLHAVSVLGRDTKCYDLNVSSCD